MFVQDLAVVDKIVAAKSDLRNAQVDNQSIHWKYKLALKEISCGNLTDISCRRWLSRIFSTVFLLHQGDTFKIISFEARIRFCVNVHFPGMTTCIWRDQRKSGTTAINPT